MTTVFRTLVLSTAHVSKATAAMLDSDTCNNVIAYPKDEYGWFVKPTEEHDDDTGPAEMETIMNHALDHGCLWIMFDRDADVDPELPTFDW